MRQGISTPYGDEHDERLYTLYTLGPLAMVRSMVAQSDAGLSAHAEASATDSPQLRRIRKHVGGSDSRRGLHERSGLALCPCLNAVIGVRLALWYTRAALWVLSLRASMIGIIGSQARTRPTSCYPITRDHGIPRAMKLACIQLPHAG